MNSVLDVKFSTDTESSTHFPLFDANLLMTVSPLIKVWKFNPSALAPKKIFASFNLDMIGDSDCEADDMLQDPFVVFTSKVVDAPVALCATGAETNAARPHRSADNASEAAAMPELRNIVRRLCRLTGDLPNGVVNLQRVTYFRVERHRQSKRTQVLRFAQDDNVMM